MEESSDEMRSPCPSSQAAGCCAIDAVAVTGELDREQVELVRASGPWRAGKYGENGENSSHEDRKLGSGGRRDK